VSFQIGDRVTALHDMEIDGVRFLQGRTYKVTSIDPDDPRRIGLDDGRMTFHASYFARLQ
jgi:hypothetical protein